MALSNEPGLSYESVKAACELLVTNGVSPESISVRDIRDETGSGSYTTIRKHRDRWHRERGEAVLVPFHIDDTELDGLRSAVEQLFSQKTNDMRSEVELSAARMRAVIERLEIDLDEVLKSNDKLQKEWQDAASRAEQLQVDVIAANLRADELAAANAKWREFQRIGLVDHRPLQLIPPELTSKMPAEPPGDSGQEGSK